MRLNRRFAYVSFVFLSFLVAINPGLKIPGSAGLSD